MTNRFMTDLGMQKETRKMVDNNGGGKSFVVSDMDQVLRFLILGTEGGTYYVSQKELTQQNVENIVKLIKKDCKSVVDLCVQVSDAGRAPKNDPAIFVMALCLCHAADHMKQYVVQNITKVCRIYTHLAMFVSFINNMRGWGRSARKAVQAWYHADRSILSLAVQMTKYGNREGFTQTDMLRLGHVKPSSADMNNLFRYVLGKDTFRISEFTKDDVEKYIGAVDEVKRLGKMYDSEDANNRMVSRVCYLIESCKLPWEVIPTSMMKEVAIWEALFPSMGMTAKIRNIARMSATGFYHKHQNQEKLIEDIFDISKLKSARVHPIQLLQAYLVYKQGHGNKGNLSWGVNKAMANALEESFYISFGAVEPSGKRLMLCLDVSGSMSMDSIMGIYGFTPALGSACMAMVTKRVEDLCYIMGFSNRFMKLDFGKTDRLDKVMNKIRGLPFESTDCSLPMEWAAKNNVKADAFVIYTDSETNCNRYPPHVTLNNYRKLTGIDAKLCVVGMTATQFTIAQPGNRNILDVVGFDTATPNLISDFVCGRI